MRQGTERCVILAKDGALREVAFKPLLDWAAGAVYAAGVKELCVVSDDIGVIKTGYHCILTEKQEGRLTAGQAILRAKEFLSDHGGNTLVLYGDAPFIGADVIAAAHKKHIAENNDATAVTAGAEPPQGAGTIRRDGMLFAVVQASGCEDALVPLAEEDAGICWFKTNRLLAALEHADGLQTPGDIVSAVVDGGGLADRYTVFDPLVSWHVETPADLLRANETAAARAIDRHLADGVLFVSRDGVVIGPDVEIGAGTTILPGTILAGKTTIGKNCEIGPGSVLRDTTVGDGTSVISSRMADSAVGSRVTFGPYSQLRAGCVIGDGAKVGDFVEIKNSSVGEETSVAHLTYIGDADVGKACNFGCGVVFVNYDGEKKYRTVVKDYAFIGCNTNLIAPVTVGEGAYTAAGTTVTEDVPDGAMAIGRARQQTKPDWARRKLAAYTEKKKK